MNRKYFTLVEVLVVIGIISILAGLLIPAVGLARQAGRRTECISNQHQVIQLLTVYMQANDNILTSGKKKDTLWTRALHRSGKLQNLNGFRCPSIHTMQNPDLGSPDNFKEKYLPQFQAALGVIVAEKLSYFDFRGQKLLTVYEEDGRKSKNRKTDYLITPSQLVLGGCSSNGDNDNLLPLANLLVKMNEEKSASDNPGRFSIVHGDECNVFFLDGHATSVKSETAKQYYVPLCNEYGARRIDKNDIHVLD